jgi:hypothetical protein
MANNNNVVVLSVTTGKIHFWSHCAVFDKSYYQLQAAINAIRFDDVE